MVIKVPKVGNSNSIRLTKTMKQYLGVEGLDPILLDMDFQNGTIVLRKAEGMSFEEAKERSRTQFDNALRRLAN